MKKIIMMSIIFIMVAMVFTGMVNAATKDSLVNDLYAVTSKYGVTESDKVRAERYVTENPVTDEQANQIYEKIKEAVQVLEDAGETDVTKLNKEQKQKILSICQEAANVIGLTLTYKNGTVEIYKDGKKIDTITFANGKLLVYTGNDMSFVLIASGVAVIALATALIVRKKFSNV